MGQYYKVVNIDKKEYLHPHELGCGAKIWEQLASWPSTANGLFLLLTNHPEPRGGGDFPDKSEAPELYEVLGRWIGDRVVVIGDYAEKSDLPDEYMADILYDCCCDETDFICNIEHWRTDKPDKAKRMQELGRFEDITPLVRKAIEQAYGAGKFKLVNGLWKFDEKT